MSTTPLTRHALYYPFHLCHETTLERLLERYATVHFRDYMALQLTAMTGLTAYQDRMGDRHPELVQAGRIVQGHSVSGPLDPAIEVAVDRDLADPVWRSSFHRALGEDRRFQRGLFDLSHSMRIANRIVPGAAALLSLLDPRRVSAACSVDRVRRLSRGVRTPDEGYEYEYGLALVKTAAALHHTVRLATTLHLTAVTDSKPHFDLLERTRIREQLAVVHERIDREGW
ncbi:hypothetical protein [Candidatus Nitrospira bockiana]